MRLRTMNVGEASEYLQRVYGQPKRIRTREVRKLQFMAKLQLMQPGELLIAELDEEEKHVHVREDLQSAARELGIQLELIPHRGRDRKVIARVRGRAS